uniref:Putative HNH homing endonuclease n=1 Tax=Jenufa perforata TaxID=993091 RepID=A0A0S2LNG0_9CHLO|nr:putative HNH homing endonuclease [Jenufa perforata]ALO62928.1 putative HNH homing endonuclease [Jenufa perforata]
MKAKKKQENNSPDFLSTKFFHKEELINFLKKENNSYSNFILQWILNPSIVGTRKNYQIHHIQPLYANKLDEDWNKTLLLVKDHAEAHRLLYECYGNYFDLCAWSMIIGQTVDSLDLIRKQNQLNMKKNKIGFYDSELQRELALRPKKKRQPYSRNKYVLAALQRGFILKSNFTGLQVTIEANECSSIQEVISKWVLLDEMKKYLIEWVACEKKQNFYLVTGLTRMLTCNLTQKTKTRLFAIKD